ncbi:hypothetical protein DPMN_059866 [Dreissena polymorpha]|uniref:Uncharacterized protein n=1 Tax=Dreissena polymorpha TaxID=45954 RepID=A0A9D4C4V5_DREPO|nr:hypothetical protein DPMN_059866 [Dreissena polymorpha]
MCKVEYGFHLPGDPLILQVKVTGSPSSVTRSRGFSMHSGALTGTSVSMGNTVSGD